MNSLRAPYRLLIMVLVFPALLYPLAASISVHCVLDPFEKYYRSFYHDSSYIVYPGMILNLSDSLSLRVIVRNMTGYDVRPPRINASLVLPAWIRVLRVRCVNRGVARAGNPPVTLVQARLNATLQVSCTASFPVRGRIGVSWLITRYINATSGNRTVIVVKKERITHWYKYPLLVLPRNVTGNYTVGDNLLSWVVPWGLGLNITLYNPALGIPGPENRSDWGAMIPLRPSMLIVYNVSVMIAVVSGNKTLYSGILPVGDLYANETYRVHVVLFNGSRERPPGPLSVSLVIRCVDDVHGVLVLRRNYTVYYNYSWVDILGAPSTVYVYDGDSGRLVARVNGPWPRRVYLPIFKEYVLRCPGCRPVVVYLAGPANVTLEPTSASYALPGPPPRRPVPVKQYLGYIAAAALILFTVALLLEKMIGTLFSGE